MSISETVGRNVLRIRKSKGLTQQQLADATGITREHIAKLEHGVFKSPGVVTVDKLAQALGVDASDLVRSEA